MRKLASLQTIKTVSSIPNSDFLELVTFVNVGWQCVANKDKFKEGDTAVFFEVDSFLPISDERFKFLEKTSYRTMYTGDEGYRLKTITLRKKLSQGLALPLSDFPEVANFEILSDVTKLLNVTKWEREPVVSLKGDIIADYPGHTPKSHQDRIQNVPEYFEVYKDVVFERTMKLEGTSQSYHVLNGEVTASSHTATFAKNDKFDPWTYAIEAGLDKALEQLNRNITIQGEFMGHKIHGNIERFVKFKFFTYNIWDIDKGGWLTPTERYSLMDEINSLMDNEFLHVPILDKEIKIFSVVSSMEELLAMADGKSIHAKYREGDVYKSVEKINGHYIQFKVISNKYLLKEKD